MLATGLLSVPDIVLGQIAEENSDTVLDPEPFVTTRANALGGALSTVAGNLDALYYNPAGIGGLEGSKGSGKASAVHGVYFPYAGLSLNANALSTREQFNAKGAQNDANAGAAIMDANAGKRQYARASFIPLGLLMRRAAIVPMLDHQIAAVPVKDSPGDVKMRYRTFSGMMFGTSVADTSNRLSLGFSQTVGTIQETTGTFRYTEMADVDQRKSILAQDRKTYAAKSTNVGMTLRPTKSFAPAFSLVARNMGNTKNTASESGADPLVYNEDLTSGFSVSPRVGKLGHLNLMIEAGHLTQKSIPAQKKIRAGMELLLGGDTGKSTYSLRLGANNGGLSYGFHMNLGFIGVQAESHAVDIGINNERVIERRSSAVISVNLASF